MAENIAEFGIKIDLDAARAQAELRRTASIADKSAKQIASASEDGTRRAGRGFDALATTLKRVAVAFASFTAIKAVAQNYTQLNTQLGNSVQLLGVEVAQLSALGRAMTRFGGDTASATASLSTMNKHMQDAKWNGGALVDVARKYGIQISAYQSADKALLSLARQMQGFSHQTKLAIMQQLGLDEAMQRALMDGGAELEAQIARQRRLGVETEEDIKITREFNNMMADLRDTFAAISRELMRAVLPLLKTLCGFVQSFVDALRKHKGVVIAFFAILGAVLLPVLIKRLWQMAAANAAAFAPFLKAALIVAAIAAVVVVIDDLYHYFMGMNSITGELVQKFPFLKTLIEPLRPLVLGIVDAFKSIVAFISDPSWEGFKEMFAAIWKVPLDLMETLMSYLESIFDKIKSFGGIFEKIGGALGKGASWLKGFFGESKELVDVTMKGGGSAPSNARLGLTAAPAVPPSAANTNNTRGDTNINLTQNQTINAPDAHAAGKASSDSVRSVVKQAQRQGGF